jgi:type II secretory ATPase GspE/PulE/Tfp pilus assembly ATPase PilB-like protein
MRNIILKLIPKQLAYELSALPIREEEGSIVVALPEKHTQQTVDDLAFLLGKPVIVETADAAQLQEAIVRLYGFDDVDVNRAAQTQSSTEVLSSRDAAASPIYGGSRYSPL